MEEEIVKNIIRSGMSAGLVATATANLKEATIKSATEQIKDVAQDAARKGIEEGLKTGGNTFFKKIFAVELAKESLKEGMKLTPRLLGFFGNGNRPVEARPLDLLVDYAKTTSGFVLLQQGAFLALQNPELRFGINVAKYVTLTIGVTFTLNELLKYTLPLVSPTSPINMAKSELYKLIAYLARMTVITIDEQVLLSENAQKMTKLREILKLTAQLILTYGKPTTPL